MKSSRVKKLRGGKQYYRRLRASAATFSLDFGSSQWYDLWHIHFDFRGYSRRSPQARTEHLAVLFTAFKGVLRQASEATRPVQVFVSIAPASEPEQDALYVHTPNPNGTPFPHKFQGVEWDAPVPAFLRRFVADEPFEVGIVRDDGRPWWVVRARSHDAV